MDGLIETSVGFFKGFSESGLEFAAEIVSPYHTEFRPRLGAFLLVGLDRERAVLGRITRFFPAGATSSFEGDEYLASLSRLRREGVPEDLKELKLRYNVHVKLLGGLTHREGKLEYVPTVRELPHLGALVGLPSGEVIRYLCQLGGVDSDGSLSATARPIGHLSLGEVVCDGKDGRPEYPVYFDVRNLVARRTYVFARAGYGKSNLIKLLTAMLYGENEGGWGTAGEPVGMLIFDPEGEYAFHDTQGRPGLANVPGLEDKLAIFTERTPPPGYERWVAGRPRLNLGQLRPGPVIGICLPEGKQEAVFANLLRGLDDGQWATLIERLTERRYLLPQDELKKLTSFHGNIQASVDAIPNNLVPLIDALHDPQSDLVRQVKYHLSRGRVVVVDISLLSSAAGERLAALLLNDIFHHNQRNFTRSAGAGGTAGGGDVARGVIPVIAVIEEAQSVLSRVNDSSPFVEWTKEGRKYQLGSILVTQQPASIAEELLSQGDNFFAFHLISTGDLKALQRVNAHFSDDTLTQLLNEPIRGNAYFWSAPNQPFVLSARVESFEGKFPIARPADGEESQQVNKLWCR